MIPLDELSSYSLIDFIPVDREVYLRMFERQNENVWPLQLFAAGLVIFVLVRIFQQKYRFVFTALALSMISVGVTFFLSLMRELSWVSTYFAIGFFIQAGLLLLGEMVMWSKWQKYPAQCNSAKVNLGLSISVFALLFFPVILFFVHGSLSAIEFIAITPDVTMIFFLGVLYLMPSSSRLLMLIPIAWSIVSGSIWLALEWYLGMVTWLVAGVCLLFGLWRWGSRRLSLFR